jgi:cytoskeleton protein RodZ
VSFGISLKRERELRGVSLEEISKSTKISVRFLKAIEADRFEVLPEGVFRKSFIKSYANYLGMNEEQILHDYALEIEPSTASQAPPERPPVSLGDTLAGSRQLLLLALAALLLLGAAGYGFWYFTRTSRKAEADLSVSQTPSVAPAPSGEPPSETPAPTVPSAAPGATRPATQPPVSTTSATASSGSDRSTLKVLGDLAKKPAPNAPAGTEATPTMELTIEASNPAWISVSAGESTLFSGMMDPSESKKFSLEAPLKVILGNAGGMRLQVNGQVFSTLGKAGERKTLEVSAANYQQYVTAPAP